LIVIQHHEKWHMMIRCCLFPSDSAILKSMAFIVNECMCNLLSSVRLVVMRYSCRIASYSDILLVEKVWHDWNVIYCCQSLTGSAITGTTEPIEFEIHGIRPCVDAWKLEIQALEDRTTE
jgi:hypothetical protein